MWHFKALTFSVSRTEHWKRSILLETIGMEVDVTGWGETGVASSGSESVSMCMVQSHTCTLGIILKDPGEDN